MKKRCGEAREKEHGFSLLELLVALALMLILSSAAFLSLNQHQKVYVGNSNKSTMYTSVRSAAELIAQEIGQAGALCGIDYNHCPQTTLSAAGATAGSMLINVTSVPTAFYVGEKLTIEPGTSSQELVQIDSIGSGSITLKSSLANAHSPNAKVLAQGVLWQGVISPGYPNPDPTTNTSYALQGSTATKLRLVGDINGEGTLSYVEYNCDFNSGKLTRTIAPIPVDPNMPAQTQTVVDNLTFIAPAGYVLSATNPKYCFQYNTVSVPNWDGTKYYTTTQILLLISVNSPNPDPQTKKPAQLTKSFLQLSPRNVLAAHDIVSGGITDPLQPLPPSVPYQ